MSRSRRRTHRIAAAYRPVALSHGRAASDLGLTRAGERSPERMQQHEADVFADQYGQSLELLRNFQDIFLVSDVWLTRFAHALREKDKKMFVFFVDLDNVPRFFKKFTLEMFLQIERRLACNTFVVASSCQLYERKRMTLWSSEKVIARQRQRQTGQRQRQRQCVSCCVKAATDAHEMMTFHCHHDDISLSSLLNNGRA